MMHWRADKWCVGALASVMVMALALVGGCEEQAQEPAENDAATTEQALEDAGRDVDRAAEDLTTGAQQAFSEARVELERLSEQARQWIDDTTQYIEENRHDLADQTLDKLEEIKSSLGAAMQQQIEAARRQLEQSQAEQDADAPATTPDDADEPATTAEQPADSTTDADAAATDTMTQPAE